MGVLVLLGVLVFSAQEFSEPDIIVPEGMVVSTEEDTEIPSDTSMGMWNNLMSSVTRFFRKGERYVAPPKPDISRMKREGCVFDGLLSRYGDEERLVDFARESECYYFHRAIETWLEAPDFSRISELKDAIGRDDALFGMFIAEAIDTESRFHNKSLGRHMDFKKMCKPSTKNFWGEHTCIPYLKREEYRLYVQYITEQAIDIGVQAFLFGQIYHQDDLDDSFVGEIIKDMREYAKSKNMEIVIGAQTNNIENESYLRQFDFIEGGIGLHGDGSIEDGPCFSRWYKKEGDWCWALMWHDRFLSKANNVIVHLDWSGVIGDDMSTFARMDESLRHKTVRDIYQRMTTRDIGFLLPYFTALPEDNGGCHGERKRYYSADTRYSCKDADAWNSLLKSKN